MSIFNCNFVEDIIENINQSCIRVNKIYACNSLINKIILFRILHSTIISTERMVINLRTYNSIVRISLDTCHLLIDS